MRRYGQSTLRGTEGAITTGLVVKPRKRQKRLGKEKKKGCKLGYALAADSAAWRITVAALDAITVFAVPSSLFNHLRNLLLVFFPFCVVVCVVTPRFTDLALSGRVVEGASLLTCG